MGIFGYSFASFLIPILICSIPVSWLQWLIIGYSAVASSVFLIAGYWQDLAKNLEGKKRWIVIAFLCAVQLTLLLTFKLYFLVSNKSSAANTEEVDQHPESEVSIDETNLDELPMKVISCQDQPGQDEYCQQQL